jgi:putative oxidoreductase
MARYGHLAPVLLRLFTAFVLMYGTQDNVFHYGEMLKFRDFLAQHGFPFPLYAAYLSAYAQFGAGFLIALGFFTRFAAATMVINFIVALVMVHRALPFGSNIAPLAMLVNSLFFVMRGAPEMSVDALIHRGRKGR